MNPVSAWARSARRFLRPVLVAGERLLNTKVVQSGSPSRVSLFLPIGYRYRVSPRYYEDIHGAPDSDGLCQPDVYAVAGGLADALHARTVVDLGCGKGGKLSSLAERFAIVGVDVGQNIEFCRATYEHGLWLEADLDSTTPLPLESHVLKDAIVVHSDVIEHLVHPEQLLIRLGKMLEVATAAVISTPDRIRTHGVKHLGPPTNRSHVREWEEGEFGLLLESCGLIIAHLGYTRATMSDSQGRTILAVCTGARLTPGQVRLAATYSRNIASAALEVSR
jgi:SAM-dependent methyltransferase